MPSSTSRFLFHVFFLVSLYLQTHSFAFAAVDAEDVLVKMETAYAGIQDYQVDVEVTEIARDGSSELSRFLYTFKKPNQIRLDFEMPHKGTVVIYPDKEGLVLLRPWGAIRFFELHLSPESFFLRVSSGQRVDQTGFGLLITNIRKSLKNQRRGEARIDDSNGFLCIGVVTDDHFRAGVVTGYRFFIEKTKWLPVGIEESTPEGSLRRKIVFQNLRVNTGVAESAFE